MAFLYEAFQINYYYNNSVSYTEKQRPIIIFEGSDGSGKTTCVNSLIKEDYHFRLPGGSTSETEDIRTLLKRGNFDYKTEYLLHLACYREFVAKVLTSKDILSKEDSQPVVVDRFWPSSIVYQHYVNNIELSKIFGDLIDLEVPFGDLIFIFTCRPEVAYKRINVRTDTDDDHWESMIEKTTGYYYNLVSELKQLYPNLHHIDTSDMTVQEVQNKVSKIITDNGFADILN